MGKCLFAAAVFACLSASISVSKAATITDLGLRELELTQAETNNASYLFRTAHFTPGETANGSGALLIALSADRKKALVSLNGVRTQLSLLGNTIDRTCIAGSRQQQVFAHEQTRLMLKLTLNPQDGACSYQGLASINLDKHLKRYMVKALKAE